MIRAQRFWRVFSARLVVALPLLAALCFATWRMSCAQQATEVENAVRILAEQFPEPVSVSPDGRLVLLRALRRDDFELSVIDRSSGRELLRHESPDRQIAPTWRPDSRAIAFIQDSSGDQHFRLIVWKVPSGATSLAGHVGRAAPHLSWSPDGTYLALLSEPQDGEARRLVILRPELREPPIVLAHAVGNREVLAWAPDGGAIATTSATDPGNIEIVSIDGIARHLTAFPHGEVTGAAWMSGGNRLMIAGNVYGEDSAQVVTLRAGTGVPEGRRTCVGTISDLRAFGQGVAYQVASEGRFYAVIDVDEKGRLQRSFRELQGSTSLLGLNSRGDSVLALHTGLSSPPRLLVAPLLGPLGQGTNSPRQPIESGAASRAVWLRASDGVFVPAYVWSPPQSVAPRRAIVLVHGGPTQFSPRTWDAGVQLALRRGYFVVALNYRGSVGYGARFESRMHDISGQVADVVAACQFVRRVLGVPRGRVVLWGHSYGALIVSRAVATQPAPAGRAVLISLVPDRLGTRRSVVTDVDVTLFQGTHDIVQEPGPAELELRRAFGTAFWLRHVRTVAVKGEGHNFRRLLSWASVYDAALTL